MGEIDRREATILSRAGKASNNKRSWYNIEYSKPDSMKGDKISIDLSTVQNLHSGDTVSEGETEEIFINSIDFQEAKKVELSNWKDHNVYEEVEDLGQQCVSTRWVYTLREADDTLERKARLVAKGFEEDCLNEIKKNSPTCDKPSLRLILSVIKRKNGTSIPLT